MEKVDCAIIGAGFAGLTCARELLKRGLSVRILEARDRIGGRVHTIRNPGQRAPIELGAEFIHGNVPEIIRPLDSHGLGYYALSDSHHFFEDGQLRLDNGFWDEVSSLSDRLDENRKTDRSVADFLAEQTASVRAKAFFRSYVEGFQAADTRKMGERGLAEEQKNEQSRSFRSVDGYGALLETYLRGDIKESLRLNTI
ncbi:MAG TPA: FAD-dependent oxidoreductase, partial [Bdellovibrionales bacterium]|nr:FAD-dependent oxidoreductase [Bdellovibrionales bacterium]